MPARHSIGLADLELLARRIADGSFPNRIGCTLEVSSFAWNQNPFEARLTFEDACRGAGIRFEVVERVGSIEWVCA